ncbi:hypothetical protein ZHAWSFBX_CDS_0024 [Agrobacterium phage Alfirin]|nr:hypothetical protein ZHAWSFBX_CDS_0024 [Agrobacterium phage Alfirin]
MHRLRAVEKAKENTLRYYSISLTGICQSRRGLLP